MLPKFVDVIENNDTLKKSQSFKEITKWYHQAEESKDTLKNQMVDKKDIVDLALEVKNGKDNFLSKLANKIVEKMVDQVKIPFVEMTLDNIRIKTQPDNPSAKINTTVKLDPLKPYVEFILKINKIETPPKVKIDFQIDSKVIISDTTVTSNKNEILLESGMLQAILTISFVELDISGIKLKKQATIGEVEFEKNLKGHSFPKSHSKKCPNCNLVYSFNDKKCKNCKHDLV